MTLMKPRAMGGLGLPNLQYDFWAAQIRYLISWSMDSQEYLWVQMESKPFKPLPLISLLFINHFEKIRYMEKCFSVTNTLQTWKDCRKKKLELSLVPLYTPRSFKIQTLTLKSLWSVLVNGQTPA